MIPFLSHNTQAILLLTAPLIVGGSKSSSELLSPGEYKRLARYLREIQRQPADLLSQNAAELLRDCHKVIDEVRLQRLLGRGFLLSQVIERWQARSIWVISRADAEYPSRLKARLRQDAPAVIYGCGDVSLLESGGLAVVGSRHVEDSLIDYTMAVGRLVARAGRTLVSGGAKGIDQAAMRGALEAGGKVSGVLADSLEKTIMNREHRNLLLDGQLVLISPYDPSAGFNVGNAMQRNKLIYALADASLVVSSDWNKGGTWAGAVEQLNKLKSVPIYVRSTGKSSPGIDALLRKGAIPWPNPQDAYKLEHVFDNVETTPLASLKSELTQFFSDGPPAIASFSHVASEVPQAILTPAEFAPVPVSYAVPVQLILDCKSSVIHAIGNQAEKASSIVESNASPEESLFATVREVVHKLLKTPMKDADIAKALNVSVAQSKVWLKRLADEGVIEKLKRPAAYVVKKSALFE